MHFYECPAEFLAKREIIAFDSAGAADQDMVGAGKTALGQQFPGERAQAALHAVADDRAANLLGHGIADADRGIAIVARTHQQDKAGHRRASSGIRGEKVCANPKGD